MIVHSAVPTPGYCLKTKCFDFTANSQREVYEGWGRVQLDNILRVDESDFELFLYYGQINDRKEEIVITVPISISFSLSLFIIIINDHHGYLNETLVLNSVQLWRTQICL